MLVWHYYSATSHSGNKEPNCQWRREDHWQLGSSLPKTVQYEAALNLWRAPTGLGSGIICWKSPPLPLKRAFFQLNFYPDTSRWTLPSNLLCPLHEDLNQHLFLHRIFSLKIIRTYLYIESKLKTRESMRACMPKSVLWGFCALKTKVCTCHYTVSLLS